MSNYMNISQKFEEFRNQFENSRKNFKALTNELKPIFLQNSEQELRIIENNRIIDTFLTSIKNTIDFNIDKLNDLMYERSLEDLSKNFFRNDDYDSYEEETFPKKKSFSFLALKERDFYYFKDFNFKKKLSEKIEKIYASDEESFSNDKNQYNFSNCSPNKKDLLRSEQNKIHGMSEHHFNTNSFNTAIFPKILPESAPCLSFCESIKNEESQKTSKDRKTSKSYKRGPYRSYGVSLKQKAIKLMEEEGRGLKEVSNELKVPTKNLKRWLKVGPVRKKGGGRKTMDPQMEALLFEWCVDQIIRNKKPVSRSLIKQQAKNFSRNKELFKASKGWLDKFMKRFNYSEKTKEILNNFRDQTKYKKLENNNYSPNFTKGKINNFIKIEPFFSVENSPIKKESKNEDQGFY